MNCVPIDMLPTQGSLLPSPWAGEIRLSLLHLGTFIHGLRCATSSSTNECDIIYLWLVIDRYWFFITDTDYLYVY